MVCPLRLIGRHWRSMSAVHPDVTFIWGGTHSVSSAHTQRYLYTGCTLAPTAHDAAEMPPVSWYVRGCVVDTMRACVGTFRGRPESFSSCSRQAVFVFAVFAKFCTSAS